MGGGATKPKKGTAEPSATQRAPIRRDPPADDLADSMQGRFETEPEPEPEVVRRSAAKSTTNASLSARKSIVEPVSATNDRDGVTTATSRASPRHTPPSVTKDPTLMSVGKRQSAGTISDGGT